MESAPGKHVLKSHINLKNKMFLYCLIAALDQRYFLFINSLAKQIRKVLMKKLNIILSLESKLGK